MLLPFINANITPPFLIYWIQGYAWNRYIKTNIYFINLILISRRRPVKGGYRYF